ncbi:Mho1p [Sporobolomyces salmoneus]|uniref:Mho1p n=1 Tax=Sporobolomyces salmoneus TaxID=183962 RepID=UPI0031701DB7
MASSRAATHAGSWYTDDGSELDEQLTQWLAKPTDPTSSNSLKEAPVPNCKAIIGPHAGYSYSGPAAAYAYKCIDVEPIKRVFVLGPSHHVYVDGCALSRCHSYSTPLGELPLDRETISELSKTGKFEWMDRETDEDEHSLEMHLPYIRKVFEGRDIKIVPILVGSISTSKEKSFGSLLAPYLSDPETLFVISSDFCHWGTRFRYTHFHPPTTDDLSLGQALSASNFASVTQEFDGQVWKGIEKLDRLGMECCAFSTSPPPPTARKTPSQAHEQFAAYLKQTKNTICGRHPIGVLLGALSELEKTQEKMRCEWVRYEQSSQVNSLRDSSVSYASAFVAF